MSPSDMIYYGPDKSPSGRTSWSCSGYKPTPIAGYSLPSYGCEARWAMGIIDTSRGRSLSSGGIRIRISTSKYRSVRNVNG